jgi:hypothetical protein
MQRKYKPAIGATTDSQSVAIQRSSTGGMAEAISEASLMRQP